MRISFKQLAMSIIAVSAIVFLSFSEALYPDCTRFECVSLVLSNFPPTADTVASILLGASVICIGVWLAYRAGVFLFYVPPTKPIKPRYRKSDFAGVLHDRPIQSREDDALGRSRLVKEIVNTIVLPKNHPSLVVALEASWGSGKTSVLNLVQAELESNSGVLSPIVVKFEPWIATGNEGMFSAFFEQFCSAVSQRGDDLLAQKLLKLAETLDGLPDRYRALSAFGVFRKVRQSFGKFQNESVAVQRESIVQSIRNAGRAIVVIIDDVDRLRDEDIRTVFQLVKAVADFERVSYLLAFDPDPIDRALSYDDRKESGSEFREKIVQHIVFLPELRTDQLAHFLRQRIAQQLEFRSLTLEGEQEELFEKAVPSVVRAARSFRDINRVANRAVFSFGHLVNEICFADLLCFETLRLRCPTIAQRIANKPFQVLEDDFYSDDGTIDQSIYNENMDLRKLDAEERLATFLEGFEPKEVAERLLRFMFPDVFDKTVVGSQAISARNSRIGVRDNLRKVLYQDPLVRLFSDEYIREFINDPSSRREILAASLISRTSSALLTSIEVFIDPISTQLPDPQGLAQLAAKHVRHVYKNSGFDLSQEAASLVMTVFECVDQAERMPLLFELCEQDGTFCFAETLLTPLLKTAGFYSMGRIDERPDSDALMTKEALGLRGNVLWRAVDIWLASFTRIGLRRVVFKEPNALSAILWRVDLDPKTLRNMQDEVLESARDGDGILAAEFVALFYLEGDDSLLIFLDESALAELKKRLFEIEIDDEKRQRAERSIRAALGPFITVDSP
ncbi:MAG: P-loop NTPase fold protein [Pseudomonadota bacterium]